MENVKMPSYFVGSGFLSGWFCGSLPGGLLINSVDKNINNIKIKENLKMLINVTIIPIGIVVCCTIGTILGLCLDILYLPFRLFK